MKSYFFNAEPTTDFASHPTGYDREYDADDHAEFFAPFFTEAGVMGTAPDACKVEVQTGNTLRICAGCAYVRGRMVKFDGTETITVTENCVIVARMNKSADVRAFQLLAVQKPVDTPDICDLELARVSVAEGNSGTVTVTDARTFMAFTGQPPYYPPESNDLPYALWLYRLGLPMTAEQRTAVEGNESLMEIFKGTLKRRVVEEETAEALGLSGVVLKNLVVNGSFEQGDEGWTFDNGLSIGPMPDWAPSGQHGGSALGGVSPFSANQSGIAGIDSTHAYYFRMLASTDGGFSSAEVRVSVGYMDNPGNSWDTLFYETSMDLSGSPMTAVSAICSNLSGDTLRIALSDNNPNYIDAVLFADLTEAFGAGNEPDKAWCDENIPYFEGSYTIEATVDEALRAIPALGVQLATGSYVGTGTFGESNPNVLTFDFEPYAVFVFSDNYQVAETFQETAWSSGGWRSVFSFSLISFFRGGSSVEVAAMSPKDLNGNLGQTITNMPYTMEGNTVSWKYTNTYGSDSLKARVQLNVSGTAYHYIAIGKGGGL